MNSYERVMTALRVEVPDRVPILEWQISLNVIEVLSSGTTEPEFMVCHLDVISTWANTREKEYADETVIDEWGARRKYLGQRYPIPFEFPISSKKDLRCFKCPDPKASWRFELLKEMVKNYKFKKAIIFCLETVFTYGWVLVGMENLLTFFRADPEFARKLLDINTETIFGLLNRLSNWEPTP